MIKPTYLRQTELVAGIAGLLEKQGVKNALPRQINRIVDAANLIVAEFAIGEKDAPPGCGSVVWRASDKTGASSLFMAYTLAPKAFSYAKHAVPYDGADFGRCVGLLDACPELRPSVAVLMGAEGPIWKGLVEQWPALEASYRAAAVGNKDAAKSLNAAIGAVHKAAEPAK